MRKATSSVAGLMAILAAAVPLASGFTCDWRGGDYSWFTYYEDIPPYCCVEDVYGINGYCPQGWDWSKFCGENFYEYCYGCGNNNDAMCCEDPYSKQYASEAKTTCCQCEGDYVFNPFPQNCYPGNTANCWGVDGYQLTAADCAEPPVDYFRTEIIGAIQGCDGFDPEVQTSDAAAQARSPGEWFTSAEQLDAYLMQTITCQDDCWELGAVYNDPNPSGMGCSYTWTAACDNTLVTATAIDRCGNTASNAFRVRYDDTAPDVSVTLGEFTQGKYKPAYETVDLSVLVSDNCDANPITSIEVFSDEVPLTYKNEPSAVLGREYSSLSEGAAITGWRLTLSRMYAAKNGMADHSIATPAPDGRAYTVRVCAKDLAGNVACDEQYVLVPFKAGVNAKILPSPINNGKLYPVASDLVAWGTAQTDIPFRLENTGLNLSPNRR